MSRSIVGSGSNLAAYTMIKDDLLDRGWGNNWVLDMIAGLGSSVVSVAFMNPIDVLRTRRYAATAASSTNTLTPSFPSIIINIIKNEGLLAFYKGVSMHFLRIGPHFVLSFVFLGIFKRSLLDYYGYKDTKDSFAKFDVDKDGVLNKNELEQVLKIAFPLSSQLEMKNQVLQTIESENVKVKQYHEILKHIKKIKNEEVSITL
ncbi:Mitochondrial oxaloacetate carrier protein [Nowakowskiella sp. JEL0407]|nr:Mitochondrial oxaloacetate carrier protein [Nowakowskiella sp. JEL0407]